MSQICRMLVGKSGFEFDSVEAVESDLSAIIESDKKYGKIKPKDGKAITWSVGNFDIELSLQAMKKIVQDVVTAYQLEFNIDLKHTKDFANSDVKITFGDEATDSNLTPNTIAYMGYPITGSKFYGICVINRKFTFTHDGKPRTGHEMVKMGIQVQYLDGSYGTLYLVKILMHEFGHGVLGLPHDPTSNNVMSSNEGAMSDYWSPRDLSRGYAKFGQRIIKSSLLLRIRNWFKIGGRR